ncbi:hypothetical protein PR048_020572, partial [Dryococelus australis]
MTRQKIVFMKRKFRGNRSTETAEVSNNMVGDLDGDNIVLCANCHFSNSFYTSKKCKGYLFESSVRFVYGMRAIGKASVKTAAEVAVQLNDGDNNIAVAFDGTWHKRGHTSENVVTTVTSVDSGKLLDFEVLTKHCFKRNLATEEYNCDKNYEGTSRGGWRPQLLSEKDRNVCYTEFLGDGDSKAHKSVVEKNPRKKKRNKILNMLAIDKTIDQLQRCYGTAIRSNTNNPENMKKQFGLLILTKSGEFKSHEHSIPEEVMEVVKHIYRDLAHPELLRKLLHGKTQNPNESFNNLIWTRLPKIWDLNEAVISFNDDNFGRVKVIQELVISQGPNSAKTFKFLDKVQIQKSQHVAELFTKEASVHKRKRILKRRN